jgi:drug/metabolite transporter (DMT)-like permease
MTPSSRPLDPLAVVLMLILCISWGFNQIAGKVALADVPPIAQAALRSLGATAVVGALALWREPRIFRRDASLSAGVVAGLLFGAEFIALYLALQRTSAARVILFLYSAPFFVALGVFLFVPRERLGPFQWVGMFLAFAGVVAALSAASDRASRLGDFLAILGAAGWGAVTVMTKATSLQTIPPTKTLLYQLAISGAMCAIASLAIGEKWPVHFSTIGAVAMAYQTFWVASVTYLVWFWLLKHYKAGELSAFTFLSPIVGVLAGHMLLGDELTPNFLAALALVAAGVVLVNLPSRALLTPRASDPAAPPSPE